MPMKLVVRFLSQVASLGILMLFCVQSLYPEQDNVSGLQWAAAGILRRVRDKTEQARVENLLLKLETEISKLRGKTVWTTRATEGNPEEACYEALKTIVTKFGPEVAYAVLYESPDDDYVRQVALRCLLQRDNISFQELPFLCKAFLSVRDTAITMGPPVRGWLSADKARCGFARQICGLVEKPYKPANKEFVEIMKRPRDWLQSTLTAALMSEKDNWRRKLIADSIAFAHPDHEGVLDDLSERKIVADLDRMVSGEASYETRELILAMVACARTQRYDAAHVLVRCLSISSNPQGQDGSQAKEDMLPVLRLLREFFGEAIAPILFLHGIRTDRPWFRNRIAFAVRAICSKEKIEEMKRLFSLEDSKDSNAQEFCRVLLLDDIPLELDLPTRVEVEKLKSPQK